MSSSPINKKTIEHLAKLARMELGSAEQEKLLVDVSKILDHFQELQGLDTSSVKPLAGGTDLKNVFREDNESESTDRGEGTGAFPEKENGFLKVPPVFE